MGNKGKNGVLIVDDEKLNIEILSSILHGEYTVYMAKSGNAAIEMAGKYLPDVILLDIVMPDINGFETLAALKSSEKTRHIPVIIITGLNSVEDEERGLHLGAADFIHKPFSAGIVQSRVSNQMLLVNQIGELVKLQMELETAVKTAEEANKTKSAFLEKVSSEILTKVNDILGVSQAQLKDETSAKDAKEIKEAFSKIFNSGNLLLGIINEILDMSKGGSGKAGLE